MINRNKVDEWKDDVASSVDLYNTWFLEFAPVAYRDTRIKVTKKVEETLIKLDDMKNINPDFLRLEPAAVDVLRMCTAPPIASDRLLGLSGLAQTAPSFIKVLATGRIPKDNKKSTVTVEDGLIAVCSTITNLLDKDIFTWVEMGQTPEESERYRASTIVADRLCGSVANPIIKNAQETRQIAIIEKYLQGKGYEITNEKSFDKMKPGTYSFRMNVPGKKSDGSSVNIPVDVIIKRKNSKDTDMPILIECKSAGDFANTNKRRKEESQKFNNLKQAYGENVEFLLFLCGYFDTPYLGYTAAEQIDWIWEHRISDLDQLNLD